MLETDRWSDFLCLRPSKKKNTVLVRISLKERAGGRFFGYLLFPIACFFLHIITFPRDTLELLSQILIQRNIRCWLNTSLFNFDKHKGLHVTVKIYFISVCTQHQWALQVTPVGFWPVFQLLLPSATLLLSTCFTFCTITLTYTTPAPGQLYDPAPVIPSFQRHLNSTVFLIVICILFFFHGRCLVWVLVSRSHLPFWPHHSPSLCIYLFLLGYLSFLYISCVMVNKAVKKKKWVEAFGSLTFEQLVGS